jgi:5-formyltetrahydrofolate cyclo-ligase
MKHVVSDASLNSQPLDLDHAKQALRAGMKARLSALPPAEAASASARIRDRVIASDLFTRASVIMLFSPLPGEVDLRPIATQAHRLGKHICLPISDWAARKIVPVRGDMDRLVSGRYGLMEPHPDAPAAPVSGIGLVLVPGLAFDLAGHRLGRGAGMFDRFLADPALRAITCAVAFDLQVVDSVPAAAHDIPIQWIVTPTRLVATSATRRDNSL